jgi:3-dehydroquinate dehydratase/shikimate dehydrogenase
VTRLCVPIFVHTEEQARRDIALAAEHGADLVELRIDSFGDDDAVARLIASSTIAVLVTCRRSGEGGHCDLPDDERIERLRRAVRAGATWVDVELASVVDHPHELSSLGAPVILSAHDFEGRPPRLWSLVEQMTALPAQVNKLAWRARSVRDNLEAFELLLNRPRPAVALCMGEAGQISRLLARKFGAFLTFASLDDDSATAPGQPTIEQLKRLYRWDAQRPETRVYGVVGSPVAHSLSPAIHNDAFDHLGFDGVYVPLLVEPGYESFKAFAESFVEFAPLNLRGLSVTIPHKENALRWLQHRGGAVDPLAERIGAVNTIVIDRRDDGAVRSLRGFSSDYDAILDTITDALQIDRTSLASCHAILLGAGGTGRTATAALASCGADVTIANRTFDRAAALASEFDGTPGYVRAVDWSELDVSKADLLINTTPIGMHPHVGACPLDERQLASLHRCRLVFDTIYNPLRTRLVEHAERLGLRSVGGIEMFVRQAAAQFSAWTGKPAALDRMRNVVETSLSRQRHPR